MNAAAAKPDAWASWKAELTGKPRDLPRGAAAQGFYEVRTPQGRQALAVWLDPDGDMIARVGSGEDVFVDEDFCERIFSRSKAIPHGTYTAVIDGKGWPDEVRLPEPKQAEPAATSDGEARPNTPPSEDVLIADQLAELMREESVWLKSIGDKITTKAHADLQSSYRDRYLQLFQKAEAARTAEKKPHLDAGRDVDRKWKPVTERATQAKMLAERRPQEFLRAEQKRLADEAAAKAAEGQPINPADVRVKAGTGRGIPLKEPKQIAVFDDAAAFRAYVITLEDAFWRNGHVKDVMAAIALTQLRAGVNVPGARLTTEEPAR